MAPTKGTKPVASSKKSKSKLSTLTLDSLPAGPKQTSSSRLSTTPSFTQKPKFSKPLTSLVKPIQSGQEKPEASYFDKGKAPATVADEDELWLDKYAPETEDGLAVHKKKVEDVRRWLSEAFDEGAIGALSKYRRILALTGPAGTGKTAVLRVLARELDFEIVEWSNTLDDNFSTDEYDFDRESLSKKFAIFFERASVTPAFSLYPPIPPASSIPSSSPPVTDSTLPSSSTPNSFPPKSASPISPAPTTHKRKIILLEDIPNVLHPGTADAFHDALEEFLTSSPGTPLVLVVSDAGTRGEDSEGDFGSRRWGKQAIDIRSIVQPTIFNSPYFTEIQFNPIAPTILVKALNNLLARNFSSTSTKSKASAQQPSKEAVQIIVESAHGDIRSAIMALQFACIVQLPKGKKRGGPRSVLEVITRREQSLALFHMLGKVLYNKRKGDPPNSSATAKAREREEELDAKTIDPPEPPVHLADHARRGSRVDVNTLYADSPIDTSLFALYLHHNYTQFCNEVEECDAVSEWMSWIDASGGEMWQAQQNPHQFHILTLGTLHGLPSPVPRRSQKIFKPEYFEVLKKRRAAEDSVNDTEAWLNEGVENEIEGGRRWGRDEVVLELSGVLKALDACGAGDRPPAHSLFTKLSFVHPTRMPGNSQRMQQLGEAEGPAEATGDTPDPRISHIRKVVDEEPTGGWLENDDIQEF